VPLAARPTLAAFRRGDLGSCVEPAEAENTPRPVQVLWIHFVVNAPFGFALGLRLTGTMKLPPWPNRPGKPEVPVIRSQSLLQRARPAKPLKPRRDLGVIQVRLIATARADELKQSRVTAFETAILDAGLMAPQDRRSVMAGLTCGR